MATKVPIYLKRGSRKGKKEKLRDILSSDMISPPLGDFRHTIHIGSGGRSDTFGDISFLQGKFHLLPRGDAGDRAEAATAPFEFSRTATVSGAEAAAAPSPLLKNAISLPALGGARALTLPAAPAPPKPPRLHLDEAVASPPCPWAANGEAETMVSHPETMAPVSQPEAPVSHPEPLVSHAGSLLSLHVDLGPSILEDVLQVMERHQAERARPQ
ncbi:BORG1 protein, partial [Brachypodius atriceps]|nr:BORG1 protein [Brachypodius atriceps]